ncbi:hypothetical protein Tco_1264434, partial [Tanacetum coccineum]
SNSKGAYSKSPFLVIVRFMLLVLVFLAAIQKLPVMMDVALRRRLGALLRAFCLFISLRKSRGVTDIHKRTKIEQKRTKPSMGLKEREKTKQRTYSSLMGQPDDPRVQNDGWKFVTIEGSILKQMDAPHGLEPSSPAINRGWKSHTADGNLLNRTPRVALTIIENKSKVRTSRNKPVVSKMSATFSSTPAYLPEITALTDVVKTMILQNKTPSPAPIKAIEETCVTCGGPLPYYKCLATDGNTFNASAATGTYKQGGHGYRPQGETNYRASNQMRPLGFPQPNVQNNQNRYNQNQGYNQNRGNNFNQGNQNYQAPFNQTQVGPSNDFSNYMKTNDNNELKNMMSNELKNMMSSFFQMQSPSGSGSPPSNTIANPRGSLKAITTRSDVSYDGPTIPLTPSPLMKEVEREPEATKDKVQTTSSGSTTHVQPPVVQVPTPEPNVALKPNPKPSIPYPSRLNDQKL